MEYSIFRAILVFSAWTITSFLCHYCAKLFLRDSEDLLFSGFYPGFHYNVIILTCMQIAFCLILRPVSKVNNAEEKREKYIILLSHACATLTTNYSMAVTHAASTFAIKLTEPLTSALSQSLFLGATLTTTQWLSIPVTVLGAVVFAEDTQHHDLITISPGTVLAFSSNVCLALRNVYMKKKHQSKTEIAPSDKTYIISLGTFCVFCLLLLTFMNLMRMTSVQTIHMCILVITSSIFHVTYSYISTVMILKHFSVVSHAFNNIMKRLIVVCLLYTTGSRSATSWNFIGLCICIAGLSLYVLSKIQTSPTGMDYVSKYAGLATRILLLAALVVTGVIYLKPHFSGNQSAQRIGNDPLLFGRHEYMLHNPEIEDSRHDAPGELSLSQPAIFNIDRFLSTDLVERPSEANKLSPLLTKTYDVVKEAQRIHANVFKSEIGGYKYAMLFDYAMSENKGDPAIAVGEILLLNKLKIKVIFACPAGKCSEEKLDKAHNMSTNYTAKHLVILLQGGGNVISSAVADERRFAVIQRFKDFHMVMFPQSIVDIGSKSHVDKCQKVFSSHKRLTLAWRDKSSFKLGKRLFPSTKSLLVPDMSYQVGFRKRYLDPSHDIIWLKRTDSESLNYEVPKAPDGYRMVVADWVQWKTSTGSSAMENIFLMTTTGLTFVQRGRVVITDRLHGHIFCTLLGIPHVAIDLNDTHTLSHYHRTWTASLENVVLANSSIDALAQAKKLLTKLDKELPKITGYFT